MRKRSSLLPLAPSPTRAASRMLSANRTLAGKTLRAPLQSAFGKSTHACQSSFSIHLRRPADLHGPVSPAVPTWTRARPLLRPRVPLAPVGGSAADWVQVPSAPAPCRRSAPRWSRSWRGIGPSPWWMTWLFVRGGWWLPLGSPWRSGDLPGSARPSSRSAPPGFPGCAHAGECLATSSAAGASGPHDLIRGGLGAGAVGPRSLPPQCPAMEPLLEMDQAFAQMVDLAVRAAELREQPCQLHVPLWRCTAPDDLWRTPGIVRGPACAKMCPNPSQLKTHSFFSLKRLLCLGLDCHLFSADRCIARSRTGKHHLQDEGAGPRCWSRLIFLPGPISKRALETGPIATRWRQL